jgi:uncharacterized protein
MQWVSFAAKSILATVVIIYIGCLLLLMIFQRELMYFPSREPAIPAEAGLPEIAVQALETSDGERLVSWFLPPAEGRPVLLYFHGNAQGLANRAARFRWMTAGGNGLLAVSYRGYGSSTGTPSEEGLHKDADAGYAFLRSRGYEPARIVAVGESLGSGVAVALAARVPVAALVLDSAYLSTLDVAATRYWMVPVRWLMRDQYRSDLRIGGTNVPLLMVHSAVDPVIPMQSGHELFALANEPKTFVEVEQVGHLALGTDAGKAAFLAFMGKYFP